MIDLTKLCTASMKAADAVAAEAAQNNTAQKAYLAATDWMMLRQLETGKPMPPEVAIARQVARDKTTKTQA